MVPATFQNSVSADGAIPNGELHPYVAGSANSLVPWLVEDPVAKLQNCQLTTLVGPPGVGKTTLVKTLEESWIESLGEDRCLNLPIRDFVRSYAESVELDALSEFRSKIPAQSLVVMESLEDLKEKSAAELELISLLDNEGAQRAFVFTTSSLNELSKALSTRLLSRIHAGFVLPLTHPDEQSRRVILHQLVASTNLGITENLINVLAHELQTAGDLQHAFLQLQLLAKHQDQTLDEKLVDQFLRQWRRERLPSIARICREVCREFGIKTKVLRGPSRQRLVVRARGVVVLLARHATDASLAQIGEFLGGRDHTTILHAENKTRSEVSNDSSLAAAVENLGLQLGVQPKGSPWKECQD